MKKNIVRKILEKHLYSGNLDKNQEIGIRIDQTLTQDSTGTMAYLQMEALGIDRVKAKKCVAYIDHNMLQTGVENADDHRYIQSVAEKYGIYFSKPGNGICHQVHLERFSVPGMTLIGSDSHTPTCGGVGMLAIGAGGLDVAVAMSGGPYYIPMPKVVNINLTGNLNKWVTAKDIILYVLMKLSVKGGVSKIFEYTGEGVKTLSVPERATITNMGAELGATTSIFPSDDVTKEFLIKQNREEDFSYLTPDEDAEYDEVINIDLGEIEPLAATPHSPDNVKSVTEIGEIKINQVAIGSCTNSSYMDMMKVAKILKDKTVHKDVSLVIAPGSKQVLSMLAKNGALSDMINAGARILECSCGPCIGMGQSPATEDVSLRTFNRNFLGRSGTKSANVYLVSPEVAAVSAISGVLKDPREFSENIEIEMPGEFLVNDSLIIPPKAASHDVEVVKGPNIKPFPINTEMQDSIEGISLIKVEDNITTDHIMPSHAKLLPYRSNIPHLSNHCLINCDENFPKKAKENGGGFIIAGDNYGQGSSREHAAIVPLYLGIKGVIAKSFARIHMANLVNNGIVPMVFKVEKNYDEISVDDKLIINDIKTQIQKSNTIILNNKTKDTSYEVLVELSDRQRDILLAGGLLNYTKKNF